MKKKYTMKEFEEMFDDAMIKAIDELDKMLVEGAKEKNEEVDVAHKFAFTMQNVMAITQLRKILFGDGE